MTKKIRPFTRKQQHKVRLEKIAERKEAARKAKHSQSRQHQYVDDIMRGCGE